MHKVRGVFGGSLGAVVCLAAVMALFAGAVRRRRWTRRRWCVRCGFEWAPRRHGAQDVPRVVEASQEVELAFRVGPLVELNATEGERVKGRCWRGSIPGTENGARRRQFAGECEVGWKAMRAGARPEDPGNGGGGGIGPVAGHAGGAISNGRAAAGGNAVAQRTFDTARTSRSGRAALQQAQAQLEKRRSGAPGRH